MGAGNVFRELIQCGLIPVTVLDEIFLLCILCLHDAVPCAEHPAAQTDLLLFRAERIEPLPQACVQAFHGGLPVFPVRGENLNVFRELIQCGLIPVTVLDEIFRQAADSRIAHNARLINAGSTELYYGEDFKVVDSRTQEQAAETLMELYCKEIEENGIERVQILSPYREDGETSVESLNTNLRERFPLRLTAMYSSPFCPTRITFFLARVMPVYSRFRYSMNFWGKMQARSGREK